MEVSGRFRWPDYLVFACSLVISASIGIYYAIRSKSNISEYLMGGRDVGVLPVAASLVVSFSTIFSKHTSSNINLCLLVLN